MSQPTIQAILADVAEMPAVKEQLRETTVDCACAALGISSELSLNHRCAQLLDRVGNLAHQQKHAHVCTELAEKNKRLTARNAELEEYLRTASELTEQMRTANQALSIITDHPLSLVFTDCIQQATDGKGEQRHGHGKPFWEQPWVDLAETYGTGFLFGQAAKKLREAQHLPTFEARRAERLGSIIYTAMGLLIEDRDRNPGEKA